MSDLLRAMATTPSYPLTGVITCVVNVLGEVKNLSVPHDLRSGRDVYVVAALDQEEIFRTATVERSLK